MEQNYYTVVQAWDFPSMEEATKHAVELSTQKEVEGWGMVLLVVDGMEKVEQLPSAETVFKYQGEIIDFDLLDTVPEDDVEEEIIYNHTVEWTKGLGLERSYRLSTFYTPIPDNNLAEAYIKESEEYSWKYDPIYKKF